MKFTNLLKVVAVLAMALNLQAKTIKDGVLTVATEGTYAPFTFYNDKNELVGYDVDIARAVAKKLNLKVEFLTAPWDAMLAAFDLKGKKDADSATSNWAKVAVKYGAEHVVTDSFAKSMELLISRRVDAVVRDNIVFYDFIKERPNAPVKIAASLDEKDYTAAAVKKDNAELAEQISNALTELSKEGKLEAISKSYFGKDVSK